jgi:hypothetical protein
MNKLTGLLLVLVSNFLFAQKFDVSVSEKMKFDGSSPMKVGNDYFFLKTDTKSQFGYTFKLTKTKYSAKLLKYDKNLNLTKEVELSNGERVYGPFKPMLKKVYDKLCFFYYQLAPGDDNIQLMSSEVDLSTLAPGTPKEILVIEQKNIALQQAMDLMTSNKLVFTASPDNSKILAVWNSGINNQVFFSVLDNDLNVTRLGNETVKGETEIAINNACIDNGGNIFIGYSNTKQTNAHVLMSMSNAKTNAFEIKIENGNARNAFVLSSATDKNIRIVGTYKENKAGITGVYSEILSGPDFQTGTISKTPFPQVLVQQFDDDGWASTKSKNYGLYEQLDLRAFTLSDGSADLAGEFRRVEWGTKSSFMIAGGMLNVHFGKNGVVFSRIPKARVSAGSDVGDSFFPVVYQNQMILFYNDHESNVKQDIAKTPSRSDNYKNSVLVAATMAADGTVKRDILIDLSKDDYLPIAEDLQRLSPSSILVPIHRIRGFGKVDEDFKWGFVEIN